MFIFKRVENLRNRLDIHRAKGSSIGFVPTMGALHEGHISLVDASREECDVTVVSVFVNPRQFNDPEDLKKYPRPIEEDIRKIYNAHADVLFLPEVEDIYPSVQVIDVAFDEGMLGNVMEGKFRPGHFKGVAEVVYRLLNMVEPGKLFLGQKDFQQVAIIRKLISDLKMPVEVVVCPTLREANGLAMSSRNTRLSLESRDKAGIIYETLTNAKQFFEMGISLRSIEEDAMTIFRELKMEPEYFEIVDGYTLQPVQHPDEADYVVACTAVKVDGIRLIDNLILKEA